VFRPASFARLRRIRARNVMKWPAERLVREEGQTDRDRERWPAKARSNDPGLNKDKIFEEVDRFYRPFFFLDYLRPQPIAAPSSNDVSSTRLLVRRWPLRLRIFQQPAQRKAALPPRSRTA